MPQFKHLRHGVFHGAMRTGKTVFTSYGFFDWTEYVIANTPLNKRLIHWNNFHVVSTTKDTAHDNVILPMIDYMKYNRNYKQVERYHELKLKRCLHHDKTAGKVTIKNDKNFWVIKYFGVNNKRSVMTFQGRTSRGMLLDEAPMMGISLREKLISRHMTFKDYKIFETGNPEGDTSHPYYQNVIKNGLDKGYLVINMQLLDNPVFDETDIEYFRKIYTQEMFDKNVLGKWVRGKGAIYKKFNDTDHVFNLYDNAVGSDYSELIIGVDYGENDFTVYELAGVRQMLMGYDFLDEYHPTEKENEEKDINEKVEDFFEFALRQYHKFGKNITIEIESATHGKTFYKLVQARIRREGYMFLKPKLVDKAVKGKKQGKEPAIRERIYTMNVMLGAKFVRFDPRCEQLILSLKKAVFNEDEETRKDTKETNVNPLDAAEYTYVRLIPKILKRIESRR